MSTREIAWVLVILGAAIAMLVEGMLSLRKRLVGGCVEFRWIRLSALFAPIAVTLWLEGAAMLCVWNLKELNRAVVHDDSGEIASHYCLSVRENDREYSRREIVQGIQERQANPQQRMTGADLGRFAHKAYFQPAEPLCVYVQPIFGDWALGMSLVRFRLTLSGWKIDRSLGWGCVISEEDRAFRASLWRLPGW